MFRGELLVSGRVTIGFPCISFHTKSPLRTEFLELREPPEVKMPVKLRRESFGGKDFC